MKISFGAALFSIACGMSPLQTGNKILDKSNFIIYHKSYCKGGKQVALLNHLSNLHEKLLIIFLMKLQKCNLTVEGRSLSGSLSKYSLAPSIYSTIVGCNDWVSRSKTQELKSYHKYENIDESQDNQKKFKTEENYKPLAKGSMFSYKFKNANNLQPKSISPTSTSHIFLLAVHSLPNIHNKLF